jgi:hypothetical protein
VREITGFTGYVRDVQKSSSARIYAILPGKPESACYLGEWPRLSGS